MTLRSLPLLLLGALAISACDSNDPVDCAVTPDAAECVTQARQALLDAAYDTTGTTITVTDNGTDGVAPGGVTWTSGFTYVLQNKVFVNADQTLTIEPGTVIKGRPGLREQSTALIIARGAQIQANGTAQRPIIFTAQADDVTNLNDEPNAGSWGGLILLGSASTNTTPGAIAIEGINTNEPRGIYGCGDAGFDCDDNDNSGTVRYVSIRYGGSEIGDGNEINGLTMGGVGRGTTVEYVEVFKNQDDGFEWFGGTVNARYLVSAFTGDELFDTDQGYRGNNQYLLGIADATTDNGFEMDGGDSDLGGEDATPLSTPTFANVTLIGAGANRAARIKENAAPRFFRSIFTGFDRGIDIQRVRVEGTNAEIDGDSESRLADGTIRFQNNILGQFTADNYAAGQSYTLAYLQNMANGNRLTGNSSAVTSISTMRNGGLNPRSTGDATTNLGTAPAGAFFENSTCIGAVCGADWTRGWTALSQLGYTAANS